MTEKAGNELPKSRNELNKAAWDTRSALSQLKSACTRAGDPIDRMLSPGTNTECFVEKNFIEMPPLKAGSNSNVQSIGTLVGWVTHPNTPPNIVMNWNGVFIRWNGNYSGPLPWNPNVKVDVNVKNGWTAWAWVEVNIPRK